MNLLLIKFKIEFSIAILVLLFLNGLTNTTKRLTTTRYFNAR